MPDGPGGGAGRRWVPPRGRRGGMTFSSSPGSGEEEAAPAAPSQGRVTRVVSLIEFTRSWSSQNEKLNR